MRWRALAWTALGLVAAMAAMGEGGAGGALEAGYVPAKGGGAVLRLTLAPEVAASWDELNVARLVLRSTAGQRSLVPQAAGKGRSFGVPLAKAEGGCLLILAELGPGAARGKADAWRRVTRSQKTALCPPAAGREHRAALAERRGATALLTAKTGARMEIRPLLNPATLAPGADLAVRAYFEGTAQEGVELGLRDEEGGLVATATTDAVGIATFGIPSAGGWAIRFERGRGESRLRGELLFRVEPASFWAEED